MTSKAQNSPEYQDYLSRRGEDNALHYSVKIDAAQLLLDNTDHTFVTPVFNGSASLRNAAGQLIENVNKGVRRGQSFDDEAIDKLFSEVTALYRLDQIQAREAQAELGPLPLEAKLLLGGLALCWIGMGVYVLKEKRKKPGADA